MTSFRVRVPATIANAGPGFDTVGIAVNLYNTFTFKPSDRNTLENPLPEGISAKPEENLVFRAMAHFYKATGQTPFHTSLGMDVHIPMARGLGSSSSAIVAGLSAANLLHGNPLSKPQLLQLATQLEGHPDNVAPALLGGVQFCDEETSPKKIETRLLPFPVDWRIAVVIPGYPVLTEEARKALPEKPSMADAIFNLRKTGLFVYALLSQNEAAFQRSLEDRLHQPYRGKLIPEFSAVADAAQTAGALGTVISGSGPTMAVFYHRGIEHGITDALGSVARKHGTLSVQHVALDLTGAIITTD